MKTIIFLIFILLHLCPLAQIDFNNYKTLLSSGAIPEDFTSSTKSKVDSDIDTKEDDLSRNQKAVFYEGINYAIDEILHSGLVIYGDELTRYASDVLDHLLSSDKRLRSELRIYTIKSNATNAFSTDQGIIFITTGLLAQITSEAQLAFILAHEVVHYKEKHVVQTFDWKSKNYRHRDRIERLSDYSRENELTADQKGVALYHAAGYPSVAISEVFDVLMYSYLPFDEVEFPVDYFNSDRIFVPESLFPENKYEITAEEDYDDSRHSHPNIKKRKEAVNSSIAGYSNWGNTTFRLGEERFTYVRNIARFESVRTDLLDASYGDALYSIFLLERDFPESVYLKRMKAQAWLSLFIYKKEKKSSSVLKKTREMEGESASLHHVLKNLTLSELTTLALRQVYDLSRSNPGDEELSAIYQKLVWEIAGNDSFKTESFSKSTFTEAANEFLASQSDSVTIVADTVEKTALSKYDRIKRKKDVDLSSNFDSTKFYLYGMYDIVSDSAFLSVYQEEKERIRLREMEEDAYADMSYREKSKLRKLNERNRMKIGAEELIVVEPKVFSSRGKKGFDPVRSEELETTYSEVIELTAADLNMTTHHIDRRSLEEKGTEGFNQRSILVSFLNQIVEDEDVNSFPVDYQLLNEIRDNYHTDKVMFTVVNHYREININPYAILFSALIYPTLPFTLTFYIPYQIMNSNNTDFYVLILDINKGIIETGNHYQFKEPLYKYNLANHAYDIFSNINSTPQ